MNARHRQPRILMLGYSRRLEGGVSKVTSLLLQNMPNIVLHPVLFSYNSMIRSLLMTFASLIAYFFRLIVPGQYRIIHVLVGSPGDAVRVLPFMALAQLLGKKVCVQFHKSTDVILEGIRSGLLRKRILAAWSRADLLCFLSERLKMIHIAICDNDVPKTVIPNLIDNRWMEAKPLAFNSRSRDIIFLGRWSWEKGVHDLVEVMNKIDMDVSCEFYTDAPRDAACAHCVFCGWISEEEVLDIVRSARLLLLPSYAEAYPTVLIEACASGTPFVATDIAGIPDIQQQSEAGILVSPGDKDAMTNAIRELMNDRRYWQHCSDSGRKWLQSLSNERIIKAWRTAYRDMQD